MINNIYNNISIKTCKIMYLMIFLKRYKFIISNM